MSGTAHAPERVTCHVRDGVADVRLSRPDKLNALDTPMFEALIRTGQELAGRADVRAVVLSGEGRGFCAGLDFGRFASMHEGSYAELAGRGRPPLGAARATGQKAAHVWAVVPVPVIAAVHGVALGGGLQIALGADLRVVAPDAVLGVLEIEWGLVPDMTGSQLLPELVGRGRAKELTFTGRRFDGVEAYRIGLATELHDDPRARSLQLAGQLAARSRSALVEAKRLLDLAGRVPLDEGLEAEQQALARLQGTEEQRRIVTDRLAARQPAGPPRTGA